MSKTFRVERLRGCIDFAVITIREDEYEAVLRRCSAHQPVLNGRWLYEFCRLRKADGNFSRVAVVRAPNQGQTVALNVARDVIAELEPRWLVLAGIAGGCPSAEFSLGDVLLAVRFHDMSVTAAIEGEPVQFRPGGGPAHPAVERLLGALPGWRDLLGPWNLNEAIGVVKPPLLVAEDIRAACYYGSDEDRKTVRDSLQRHFPTGGAARPPLFRSAAVGTANVLLKDMRLLADWRRSARDIEFVEMEAGGVLMAARQAPNGEIPLLCVRGISDIIGFKRSPEWTEFACNVAASFLHAIFITLPAEMFGSTEVDVSVPNPLAFHGIRARVRRLWNVFWNVAISSFESVRNVLESPSPKDPTIDEIIAAFKRSSSPLLAHIVDLPNRIERNELKALLDFRGDSDVRTLCLLGAPGTGKTTLLAVAAKDALDSGVATLAIKADVLPPDEPFDSWSQRQLGLGVTAFDAVRAVSSRSRVLVVIDQLDSLSATVDLNSRRLNDVMAFIATCTTLPSVSVICSCRTFDFNHDARFRALRAKQIELSLPPWAAISAYLTTRGVTGTADWPEAFRELLRVPQHLQLFLQRFSATGRTNPFSSYQLMLDDLWNRCVERDDERTLLYRLAECLITTECTWAPLAKFEESQAAIRTLESKLILQTEAGRVGFRHQTLLEHAKARLFARDDRSFFEYVTERQDAIFVRPTVWAVLQYLRATSEQRYRAEIEALFSSELRLHLRFLLIEFLGQVAKPQDFEVALLASRLANQDEAVRVLIAIRGSSEWFRAFQAAVLPTIMQGPVARQWPLIGVFADAWAVDYDACLRLIRDHWLTDPEKDQLSWRALQPNEKWIDEAVDMVCTLIRRASPGGDRLWWAEGLVSTISASRPELAPRVFIETVSRVTSPEESVERWHSPLESTTGWYDLPAVAEAAPEEFLRVGWGWLVGVCESYHSAHESSVVYTYRGNLLRLDDPPGRPEAPILTSFLAAIDAVATKAPDRFIELTKASWSSENAVVHRLIVRGLCVVSQSRPNVALEYLTGDRRRFQLGSYETHYQSDSIALIRVLAPRLSADDRARLERLILSWSMYRDDVQFSDERSVWIREAQLRLLAAIPSELLSPAASRRVEREKIALPNWNYQGGGVRGGFVREIPPISKEEMETASNDTIVEAVRLSRERKTRYERRVEVVGGWEAIGGPHTAAREIGELAKGSPARAVSVIKSFVENGDEEVVATAIHDLSDTPLSDDELFALLSHVASCMQQSKEVLSSFGYVLYRRCRQDRGFADDVCSILRTWLSEAWKAGAVDDPPKQNSDKPARPEPPTSVLWTTGNTILDAAHWFWPLLAATHGYLLRREPDTNQWLVMIEHVLDLDLDATTWAHYCPELQWIRIKSCDRARGASTIARVFAKYPQIRHRQEGVHLIAQVSDLLPMQFLDEFLESLRTAQNDWSRQAFGELLTLLAFRREKHPWARDKLFTEVLNTKALAEPDESVVVGIAFAAGHMWDAIELRSDAARILCLVIPNASPRSAYAIQTVFWAREDFVADEPANMLLQALADNPTTFAGMQILDVAEHLLKLVLHERALVLKVCKAILVSGRDDTSLYEAGPQLVSIAMTLQRFDDTRSEGLSLLEDLLRRGLDDAFRILRDIDTLPSVSTRREPLRRRRRRK